MSCSWADSDALRRAVRLKSGSTLAKPMAPREFAIHTQRFDFSPHEQQEVHEQLLRGRTRGRARGPQEI
eukprot:2733814-Rhodomonas_salina.1